MIKIYTPYLILSCTDCKDQSTFRTTEDFYTFEVIDQLRIDFERTHKCKHYDENLTRLDTTGERMLFDRPKTTPEESPY